MLSYKYNPKTPTQQATLKNLLHELARFNSMLVGEYETITTAMKTKVKFICGSCKSPGEKNLKQIYVSGGICHTCTQKNKMDKLIQTNLKNLGVENISQLVKTKEKKRKTALTNGFLWTKQKWFEKVKEKQLDTVWEYLFDEISGYENPHLMKHIPCGISCEKSPKSHLEQDDISTSGQGCLHCYHNVKRLTAEELILEGRKRHGDRFKYDKIPQLIQNNRTKITIECLYHGSFQTTYTTHLYNSGGCLACSNKMKTKREILDLLAVDLEKNSIVLRLEDYDNDQIINNHHKLKCSCLKDSAHPFWFANLANLKKGSGCPSCVNKTEAKLFNYLIKHYPGTIRQLKLESCKLKRYLPFDFAIPELKIIIEVDGRQHFIKVSNWGDLDKIVKTDVYKMRQATKQGVFEKDEDWLDLYLLPEVKSESRNYMFISTIPEVYKEHIKMIKENTEITQSDLEEE
jgi:hypothetical protein